MTIKSKKKSAKRRSKTIKRKSNPAFDFIEKIIGKKKELKDSNAIEVEDGVIIFTGKDGLDTTNKLKSVLTASQKNVVVKFYPRSSPNKGYILNRPEDYVKEDIERLSRRVGGRFTRLGDMET